MEEAEVVQPDTANLYTVGGHLAELPHFDGCLLELICLYGYSQSELATAMGVPQQKVSQAQKKFVKRWAGGCKKRLVIYISI